MMDRYKQRLPGWIRRTPTVTAIGILIPLLLGGIAVQIYEASGAPRVAIALTAAGASITIALAIGFAALWLRRMEDRLQVSDRALAATGQGVFVADGNSPQRPIIYVSEAFTHLSGYSEKDAIGRSCDFLVNATSEDAARRTLATSLATRTNCAITLPCTRRDGTAFSGRLSISGFAGADGTSHLVGLIEDVTAEQLAATSRLELPTDASQARTDAEAATRAKDVFFSSITHALRSPMNACLMWLDVLALGPQSDKSSKALDAITRNLKIQACLVNDLIDAAKISSGGIEIHRETIELDRLLENHIETWQLMASALQVRFTHHRAAERYALSIDAERLLQVLNSLLENAFRNTPAGGEVVLSVAPRDGAIAIDVEDNGAGLSPEDLQRVFTPFCAPSTSREHKGSGLGLAIAQHLVHGHEGTLTARSDGSGKGCVFTILLPLPSAPARAARADHASQVR